MRSQLSHWFIYCTHKGVIKASRRMLTETDATKRKIIQINPQLWSLHKPWHTHTMLNPHDQASDNIITCHFMLTLHDTGMHICSPTHRHASTWSTNTQRNRDLTYFFHANWNEYSEHKAGRDKSCDWLAAGHPMRDHLLLHSHLSIAMCDLVAGQVLPRHHAQHLL